MMKTKLIFLMKMRIFQKAHVSYSDVADMLHVGKIAPFHLFLSHTKELESITEIVKDDYGHKYHSGSKIICGRYLEIFEEDKTFTKYYVGQREAAVLS